MIILEVMVIFFLTTAVIIARVRPAKFERLQPIVYAFIAGVIGGQQNLFFKGVGKMVTETLSGTGDPFKTSWNSYIFVFSTIGLAISQISFINQGLQQFDGVLFLPIYSSMMIIWSTFFGSIYYREFNCFTVFDFLMYLLGMIVTLVGCSMLPMVHTSKYPPKEKATSSLQMVRVPSTSDTEINTIDIPGGRNSHKVVPEICLS